MKLFYAAKKLQNTKNKKQQQKTKNKKKNKNKKPEKIMNIPKDFFSSQ